MKRVNNIEFKPIDNSVFESLDSFIYESLQHFHCLDRLNEDITIYMPQYFFSILSGYYNIPFNNKSPIMMSPKFMGVKVIDGYENKIIVAIKDGILHNIEPKEMLIP